MWPSSATSQDGLAEAIQLLSCRPSRVYSQQATMPPLGPPFIEEPNTSVCIMSGDKCTFFFLYLNLLYRTLRPMKCGRIALRNGCLPLNSLVHVKRTIINHKKTPSVR